MRAPTKSVLFRMTWPAPYFPSRICIRAFWVSCWKVCLAALALTGNAGDELLVRRRADRLEGELAQGGSRARIRRWSSPPHAQARGEVDGVRSCSVMSAGRGSGSSSEGDAVAISLDVHADTRRLLRMASVRSRTVA